jgi:hypothetical protein
MKKNLLNVVVTVVIFTFIAGVLLTSCTNCNSYLPYRRGHYTSYEGFSDYNPRNKLNYSSIDKNQNTDSDVNNYSIIEENTDNERHYGFNGLFSKPGVVDSNIDIFSNAKGSPSCFGNSSGLSNSMGSLCLDNNLTTLLRTRGGNQTSGDMQIGY